MVLLKEIPKNIEELVKDANCKSSWKKRFNALNELRKYDCQQSRDVITRLAIHDKVFKIKEEACRACQTLGIEKNGKPINLTKKNIGYSSKDFIKLFQRIKRDKKMIELDMNIFKDTFKTLDPEMYDVMEFENKNFDSWIENIYKTLPNK